ncbi:MAG: hypothetical protein JJE03_06280 [Peptostreptococcaceae bacterium]|nr:hypothetical protein [Peptostreptococcaceae bacterium]
MALGELTTIVVAMIGITIIIVKAINKNTSEAVEMKEQFKNFRENYRDDIDEVKEDLGKHEDCIIELDKTVYYNGKRIDSLEDWKREQQKMEER